VGQPLTATLVSAHREGTTLFDRNNPAQAAARDCQIASPREAVEWAVHSATTYGV